MKVEYRKIEAGDNLTLALLLRTVLKEFGIDQPGTVYTDPTTDNLFELFQAKNSLYFVATTNDKIIGGCGLYPTEALPDGCIELVKFYLYSEYRGLGIGKKLMELCLQEAKNKGYKSVYLESLPELSTAVGMYQKAGFKHIAERLGNSGHFACNVLMLCEI